LVEFFRNSPLVEADLDFERVPDYGETFRWNKKSMPLEKLHRSLVFLRGS
jgi:hypothetical protein